LTGPGRSVRFLFVRITLEGSRVCQKSSTGISVGTCVARSRWIISLSASVSGTSIGIYPEGIKYALPDP
jgi:hypothetical protein